MARDGVNLAAMTAAAAAAVPVLMRKRAGRTWDENATLRDQIAKDRPSGVVRWEGTEHGWRPRFVDFYGFRGSFPCDLVHRVELPHWDAAWEVVEDLSEPMALAA